MLVVLCVGFELDDGDDEDAVELLDVVVVDVEVVDVDANFEIIINKKISK